MSERWITALAEQGARFADGRVADFGDARAEMEAPGEGAVIADLSHEGLILVAGEDAATYLQAQFTNDVLTLPEDGAQWNGWCSPKGRLLATFLLWQGRQGFFLQLPRTLQAAIQKRMQMFVLRAKVVLSDESGQFIRFGIAGPRAPALVAEVLGAAPEAPMRTLHLDRGRVIRLSANRFEFIAKTDDALAIWNAFGKHCRRVGSPVWERLAIADGVITVQPATQDAFVPQMANFELAGGVSFKKGCYPGQEIVARTQYRGILKRRMAHVHVAADLKAGDALYAAEFGDQVAGTVAMAAPSPAGGSDALVVAQIESINAGSLRALALDGPALEIKSLPYGIPELGNAMA